MCVRRCHPERHVISPFLTHSACPSPPIPEVSEALGGPRWPSATTATMGREGGACPCSPRGPHPPTPILCPTPCSPGTSRTGPDCSRAGLSACTAARASAHVARRPALGWPADRCRAAPPRLSPAGHHGPPPSHFAPRGRRGDGQDSHSRARPTLTAAMVGVCRAHVSFPRTKPKSPRCSLATSLRALSAAPGVA